MKLTVESLPITALLPYARNSRTHSDEQVAQIAASIKEFGFTNPILISPENDIIAGHGRLAAATRLGLTEVPCIRLGHLTPTQRKAYVIADNRLALNAGWDTKMLELELVELQDQDFDLGLLGFSDDELDALLNPSVEPTEGLTDPDEVPEQVETRCKPGDLWILGNHRLLCGDSTNVQHVERLMGGEKADLWVTDPPYGVAYESAGRRGKANQHSAIKNDAHPLDEMGEFWATVSSNAHMVCSDESSYYWFACQGGDQMMMMMMSISRAGWKVRHELIWVKDQMVFGRCDYHYKHEPILYGWKQDGTHNWYADRKQTSVLEFPRPKKSDEHPTMKPVDLVEYLLANNSRNGGRVLDTFLGSGTTLIACEKTGRRCYGMELDPKYCDVILARWEKFTGKTAELVPSHD